MGSITSKTNQKHKITNPQIKQAKLENKKHKRNFNEACREKSENIIQLKTTYMNSQKNIRALIEEQHRANMRQRINKIITEGGANSNTFWKLRKKLMNHNKKDEYTTITEEGETLNDPQRAKEYIANYFENLYQARDGETSHAQWTEHINDTANEATNANEAHTNEQPITLEELNESIKKTQKRKEHGTRSNT